MAEFCLKFYSNENIPLPVVEEIRKLGHDVLTSSEAGKANLRISDDEVLDFATEEKRLLLTINRKDFIRLDRNRDKTRNPHSGIVVCTRDGNFTGQARRIVDAVLDHGDMNGQLVRVNRPDR